MWFSSDIIYVRFSPNCLFLKSAKTKKTFEDIPLIAFEGNKILAVGKEAKNFIPKDNEKVSNPFDHQRLLISDMNPAVLMLLRVLDRVVLKTTFIRPIFIIHPLKEIEYGLAEIEVRMLVELGTLAGARKVYVWVGSELMDEEIAKLKFPPDGQLLETYKTQREKDIGFF